MEFNNGPTSSVQSPVTKAENLHANGVSQWPKCDHSATWPHDGLHAFQDVSYVFGGKVLEDAEAVNAVVVATNATHLHEVSMKSGSGMWIVLAIAIESFFGNIEPSDLVPLVD